MYIFSTKSLISSVIGLGIGLLVYAIIGVFMGKIGLIIPLIFAVIGFGITTLKVPETNNFNITRKTGGEKIDDVIMRAIKFKAKGKRIFVYTKEEQK